MRECRNRQSESNEASDPAITRCHVSPVGHARPCIKSRNECPESLTCSAVIKVEEATADSLEYFGVHLMATGHRSDLFILARVHHFIYRVPAFFLAYESGYFEKEPSRGELGQHINTDWGGLMPREKRDPATCKSVILSPFDGNMTSEASLSLEKRVFASRSSLSSSRSRSRCQDACGCRGRFKLLSQSRSVACPNCIGTCATACILSFDSKWLRSSNRQVVNEEGSSMAGKGPLGLKSSSETEYLGSRFWLLRQAIN
jgi:hypothetical protein